MNAPLRRMPAAAVLALALAALKPVAASALTYEVNNPADDGPGSLREAIQSSNSSSLVPARIEFRLPDTVSPVIELGTVPLPAITQPVLIDGTTQPGTH